MDGVFMTLVPNCKDFRDAFNARGYELRDPHDNEPIRLQRGYRPENALMLDIPFDEKGHEFITLTVNTRPEEDETVTGFIAMSGKQLDYIPYEHIVRTYSDWIKGTRADVAVDITFPSQEELDEAHIKLCKKAGFDPKRGKFTQNPDNDLAGGRRNKKRPIKKASLTASEGLTLYIGSRQSKFMVRAYDKSAEVLAKTGKVIEPTLRVEIEVKREAANGLVKKLINSQDLGHDLAPMLWNTLADDHISFKSATGLETLAEVMGIDQAEIIKLDYSKIEGEKMEYERWLRKQAIPKYEREYGHLDVEDKVRSLSRIGFFSQEEMATILGALIYKNEA